MVGSLFHTGVSDLIEQELTPEGDAYWYDNDINASSNGAEIKADFRRRDGVWAYLSYSLTNTHMDNSPRQLFKGGVSTSPFAPLHAGLEAVYESSRLTRDGGRSDPFLLLNGTVSRQLGPHVRLGLTARNLLDRRYATPVGPELRQETIRQDRRTLTFELTWSR